MMPGRPSSTEPSYHRLSEDLPSTRAELESAQVQPEEPRETDPILRHSTDSATSRVSGDRVPDSVQEEPASPVSSSSSSPSSSAAPVKAKPQAANLKKINSTDGVFANMSAKPSQQSTSAPQNGDLEPGTDDLPPPYEAAAEDSAPPYPVVIITHDMDGEALVDGMPVGTPGAFFFTLFMSIMFQVVGFLIAFLFSTTHAGKSGARAGFGLLMIQYGMFIRQDSVDYGNTNDPNLAFDNQRPLNTKNETANDASLWVSYLLMILGWFIVIQATTDYIRVKRLERIMQQRPTAEVLV